MINLSRAQDLADSITDFSDPFDNIPKKRSIAQIRKEEKDLQHIVLDKDILDEDIIAKIAAENQDRGDEAKAIFVEDSKLRTERKKTMENKLTKLWATIWGQCSLALQEEIAGDQEYDMKSAKFDSMWLL